MPSTKDEISCVAAVIFFFLLPGMNDLITSGYIYLVNKSYLCYMCFQRSCQIKQKNMSHIQDKWSEITLNMNSTSV